MQRRVLRRREPTFQLPLVISSSKIKEHVYVRFTCFTYFSALVQPPRGSLVYICIRIYKYTYTRFFSLLTSPWYIDVTCHRIKPLERLRRMHMYIYDMAKVNSQLQLRVYAGYQISMFMLFAVVYRVKLCILYFSFASIANYPSSFIFIELCKIGVTVLHRDQLGYGVYRDL